MFGLFGALSGYIKAQKTGRGESIDVAQYEILMRVDSAYWSMHMTDGFPLPRTGSGNPSAAAMDNYRCKNGNLITILVVGFVAIKGQWNCLALISGPRNGLSLLTKLFMQRVRMKGLDWIKK